MFSEFVVLCDIDAIKFGLPDDLAENVVTTRNLHLTCLCSDNFSRLGNSCLHWPQISMSGVSANIRNKFDRNF